MSETSRRKFLAVAGAGAAAGAAAGVTSGGAAFAGETQQRRGSARETVVAYVKDHRSSELRLMVGEREVVVHDRDLVNRILNAAGER
jgi:DMSO/TMAO reductase YedYZ molybdopterin-dependent catalytic subunit